MERERERESERLSREAVNLTSVCAYGGGPMGEQLSALKKGPTIRRISHWRTHSAYFAQFKFGIFGMAFLLEWLVWKSQGHRLSQKLLASQKIQVRK